jgi:hypothetical protein
MCDNSFNSLSALLVNIFRDFICGDHVSLESNVMSNIFMYFLIDIFLLCNLILSSPTFNFLVKIMQFNSFVEKLKPFFADRFSK